MLLQEHALGLNQRLMVGPADTALGGCPILRLDIEADDVAGIGSALLTRMDVEHLRDLCDEALA